MQQPIFILAPPRSFTSLVNAMLGQHPQIYGLPELNLFLADTLGDLWQGNTEIVGQNNGHFGPMMRHGLLRTVAQIYTGEQTIETVQMARNWVRARETRSTAEVYREITERIAPRATIDKSPAYSFKLEYMQRILEAFPDGRFIHLLRHPRGQCESVMKVAHGAMALLMDSVDRSGPRPVIDPQIAWHGFHMTILEFLRQVPDEQQVQVKGEDFFSDTDGTLRAICMKLGIRHEQGALDDMKHPEDSPFACMGPVNAILGNDINFLKDPAIRFSRQREQRLGGPLSWRRDGKEFTPEVVQLALDFGYH